MDFKRATGAAKDLYMGQYHLGRDLTDRFFNSKWSGVFDAFAGAGITALMVNWTLNNAAFVVTGLAMLTSAPLSGLAMVAAGTVFTGLCVLGVGLGTGFMAAAYKKSGLPWPQAACGTAVDTVKNAVSAGVDGTRKIFKAITPEFMKASQPEAEIKKPAPAPAAKPYSKPVF